MYWLTIDSSMAPKEANKQQNNKTRRTPKKIDAPSE